MALRLTGISLAAASPTRPERDARAASGSAFAARLSEEARACLAAHQLDGYRDLFARAAEHDDAAVVFFARVKLIEEGLSAAGRTTSQTRATQLFVAAAQAALGILEEEPREPILLNYAAVALYELWSLDAAHALFKAVKRLDPAMPHLERNLKELGRRRRDARRLGAGFRALHAEVPGLAARAKRIASRARPAQGLTLSLCMIVRDEEEMLPKCLAAVAPAVDEIVIVDTGSKDRTVEIAREFGARVIEREWTGSFAEARNVSFDAATGDWVMYLDADEVLVAEDVARLRELTGRVWREAFYLVETSYTGEDGDGSAVTNSALRVFRNRPHYRFEGRLHEQIAHNLPPYYADRIEQSSVRIDHYGYLGRVRNAKEKSRRNLELLRAQESEGRTDAFLHYNLGTEYALLGEHDAALTEFERAWSSVQRNGQQGYDFVPALRARLVNAYGFVGRAEKTISEADDALKMFPDFTDLVYAQAVASLVLRRDDDAIAYWERCIEMGDAPPRYGSMVGTGTYRPRIEIAKVHVRRGELEPARELLDWCLVQHPGYLGVVQPYASLLLRLGRTPDEVADEIEARVGDLTPSGRYVLGSTLHAHGGFEAAERQYRAALARRPQSDHVRAQLAEMLLDQGRYEEAAAEAGEISEESAFAALAGRIELWGRIACGDLEGARGARGRAVQAGVPAVELETFDGWFELQGGAAEPRQLPVAATPLLGVILESLLRVHQFETFEKLVGLLERSALPYRERRELLGSMYLKHGFLASAAREWMAVCERKPDVRALVGLARVAAANGQHEDAAVFAGEALQHDPGNPDARSLIALAA